MTILDMIKKTSAGLRRMDKAPDYLIFMKFHCNDDTVWDALTICNIPVIHVDEWLHSSDDKDCPFYPGWIKEGNYTGEVAHFRRGFEES